MTVLLALIATLVLCLLLLASAYTHQRSRDPDRRVDDHPPQISDELRDALGELDDVPGLGEKTAGAVELIWRDMGGYGRANGARIGIMEGLQRKSIAAMVAGFVALGGVSGIFIHISISSVQTARYDSALGSCKHTDLRFAQAMRDAPAVLTPPHLPAVPLAQQKAIAKLVSDVAPDHPDCETYAHAEVRGLK